MGASSYDSHRRTVLITGARSPVALELSRIMGRAGHRVITVDPSSADLCKYSRYVDAAWCSPSPQRDIQAYFECLSKLILQEKATLLIPTCEEVFYIARIRDHLPDCCDVLVDDFETLQSLHHKGQFVELAKSLGLSVPMSALVGNVPGDSLHGKRVFKPSYSRFGYETMIATQQESSHIRSRLTKENREWIEQEFIQGREVCCYAIANQGQILTHVSYKALANQHQAGPSLAFEAVSISSIDIWIQQFASKLKFTGQISFDFIVDETGSAFAIECNPRATSGIHLLATVEGIATVFTERNPTIVEPNKLPRVGLKLATILINEKPQSAFQDAIYKHDDPMPGFGQIALLTRFGLHALLRKTSISEEMMRDIAWNGEEIPFPETSRKDFE